METTLFQQLALALSGIRGGGRGGRVDRLRSFVLDGGHRRLAARMPGIDRLGNHPDGQQPEAMMAGERRNPRPDRARNGS